MEKFNSLVENYFFQYLLLKGYPKESIVYEWKVDKGFRADFAIVDAIFEKPIAIYEIISEHCFTNKTRIDKTISHLLPLIKNGIPCFIISPKEKDFIIFKVNGDTDELEEVSEIPDYNILVSKPLQEVKKKNMKAQGRISYLFQIVCWIISVLVLLALILDFCGVLKFTIERLILTGLVIGLIVVPFSNKLKILGLEFERYEEKTKE